MDPTGEGITKAGKIVAMISVILSIVAAVAGIIVMLALAVFAATSSGGTAP